ncbi:hypothetical protein [Tenacibaculum maritimum]|uniref:hypothetical protein n=1 Tax=Tenacibaculum maritimum TaxID=107401 RepID=UPI0012E52F6B|nr:hypothetical protein [Tenacibaculum maritimum]CAA0152098.1 conserved hypothetical protein [Tenacibaculum maritimum]
MAKETQKERLLNKFSKNNLEESVYMQSKGRTSDLDLLTTKELQGLYFMFFPMEKPRNYATKILQLENEKELKRLRSVVLSDAQKIGLYTPGNWNRFNQFMSKNSVFKKSLSHYKIEEFPELIKQFKSMRYKFEKSKTTVGSKAWYQFLGLHPSLN